jgi:hypothetical protein
VQSDQADFLAGRFFSEVFPDAFAAFFAGAVLLADFVAFLAPDDPLEPEVP